MAEKELVILVRAKGAVDAANDIGKVDSAVTNVGTKGAGHVDTLKGKFGQLRTELGKNTTQIGIVSGALAAIESFVPPTLRPIVDGLQDLNRIAPNGLPGLVSTALTGLKTITATTVTVVGQAVNGPSGPGGPGGENTLSSIFGAILKAAIVLTVAEAIGPPLRQFAIDNGLAGSGSNTGKTQSQIANEAARAQMAAQFTETQREAQRQLAATDRSTATAERIRDAVLGIKAPIVNVTASTSVNVSAQSVTSAVQSFSTWTGSTRYNV